MSNEGSTEKEKHKERR